MPKQITLAELAKHNKETDAWIAIKGRVYDITEFIEEHPGGEGVLIAYAGKDVTTQFEQVIHSQAAEEIQEELYIGDLVKSKL